MATKIMFRTKYSCITIKDGKMYTLSNKYKDYSPRAITIISGFQIELGRNINDIETALKETRLPIILKTVTDINDIKHIQIIRMHTGRVDDKIVAIMSCKNNIITSVSFNKDLIKDAAYRKYNSLSVYHQLSMPYSLSDSGYKFRRDQVLSVIQKIIPSIEYNEVEVVEKGKQLIVNINDEDVSMKMLFISNKNNNDRYELMSISLL